MDAARPPAPAAEFARIEHSEALLAAIRRRVAALGLTHEKLDHWAGFASGYSSKLLADPPIKRLGNLSLFLMLQALGLDILLIENPQRLESLKNRRIPRPRQVMLRAPSIVHLTPDFLRLIGTKGARARNQNLTPMQRSTLAKRAARARWARVRAATTSPPALASP